jgi:Domain of unknown function (DUF4132)
MAEATQSATTRATTSPSPSPTTNPPTQAPSPRSELRADWQQPAPGFVWTDALRNELPALRGLQTNPRPLSRGWLDYPIVWRSDLVATAQQARFEGLVGTRGWTIWTDIQRSEALSDTRLAEPSPEHWQQCLAQTSVIQAMLPAASQPEWIEGLGLTALMGVGLARHGLPFMLEQALAFVQTDGRTFALEDAYFQLRKAIVVCSDAEHAQVLKQLSVLDPDSPEVRYLRAYLCPQRADWVAQALRDPKNDARPFRLRDALMSAEAAQLYLQGAALQRPVLRSTLLLQLHLHGPAALGLVAKGLMLAREADEFKGLEELLAQAQGPLASFLRAFRKPGNPHDVETALAGAPAFFFDTQRLRDTWTQLAAHGDAPNQPGRRDPLLQFQLFTQGDAALPLLAHKLDISGVDLLMEALFMLLACVRSPAALPLLLQWRKRAPTLERVLERLHAEQPEGLMRMAAQLLAQGHPDERALSDLLLAPAAQHPALWLELQAQLPPALQKRLATRQGLANAPQALAAQLPAVLREPPWLRKAPAKPLPTLNLATPDLPTTWQWADGERELQRQRRPIDWLQRYYLKDTEPEAVLRFMGARSEALPRLLAGEAPQASDFDPTAMPARGSPIDLLCLLPDPLAIGLWNVHPTARWLTWDTSDGPILALLARGETAALPGLVAYAQSYPEQALRIASRVTGPDLVPRALQLLVRGSKRARTAAQSWLLAQPALACAVALPLAFGAAKAARTEATQALRWLVSQGHEAALRDAAQAQGPAAQAAVQALLDSDPLVAALPSRMPKLPLFFQPSLLRKPLLAGSHSALPADALEAVGLMLRISSLEEPYPGLAELRSACTPDSLADFAWDLFEAWMAADSPSKEAWAFQALALLGNDDTARRLTPLLRQWPSEGASARAAAGLDVLAALGSDVALMHLNGLAERVKSKPLQEKARAKIAAVAESLQLSAAELADRLVPDLGLADDGGLRLDFGPRHFVLRLDETLKPCVHDANGLRLKDLPAPRQDDDADKAAAAVARFKQIKKDTKAVAAQQVPRLEHAMAQQRRWPAASFAAVFQQHGLMRHLAARLLWGTYREAGGLETAFRIAEDWTLADAQDSPWALPATAHVGVVHPLDLNADDLRLWAERFADYEILQPFKQLAREHYRPDAALLEHAQHPQVQGRRVTSVSLLGLVQRGWEAGEPISAGRVFDFSRRLPNGVQLTLSLEPGMYINGPTQEPVQTLQSLEMQGGDAGKPCLAQLGAIGVSELWRDLALLETAKA